VSWILIGMPIGAVLLYLGSGWLVEGAKRLAIRLGVTPFLVGLTVVALGLSVPEVATALASGHNPQMIIGNIVGSNIANVGLAIGLAAVISPVVCRYAGTKFEIFSMLAAVLIVSLMALTGTFGHIEGAILLIALFVFIYFTYRIKRNTPPRAGEAGYIEAVECKAPCLRRSALLVALGILFLYLGAMAFIEGASELAKALGMSHLMVGLVVVAVGVSLPELCICIVAAYRGENEIMVSNIIGSIIFNCFFALGAGVIFTAVEVTYYTLVFHLPVMVLMAAILALLIKNRNGITRWGGAMLVCIYSVYIALMLIFPELTQGLI